MAGLIRLNKEYAWSTAGWAFDHVLRLTREQLPKEGSAKILELMNRAEAGTNYLSLEKLSPAEVGIFRAALEKAYAAIQAEGSQSFNEPDFYPGFMEQFAELMEMIRKIE